MPTSGVKVSRHKPKKRVCTCHKSGKKLLTNKFYACWQSYHAKCEKWLSTEHATTSQFMALNSSTLSLNAVISVGHMNVLDNKQN